MNRNSLINIKTSKRLSYPVQILQIRQSGIRSGTHLSAHYYSRFPHDEAAFPTNSETQKIVLLSERLTCNKREKYQFQFRAKQRGKCREIKVSRNSLLFVVEKSQEKSVQIHCAK